MSSDNKSSGMSLITILLAALVFLIVAGGSWYYFSHQNPMPTEEAPEEQMVTDEEATEDMGAHDHGHDHDHDHGHSHGEAIDMGESGTIYEPPVNSVLGVRSLGDKNAPIQIREYFSLTCNHCANFHETTFQQIKEKYIDTGKVYFIYEEFPLNGPALYGSMIARCLPEERYAGFIDILLRNQDKWVFGGDFKAGLKQNAALAGMSDEDFEKCFNDKELQAAVASSIKQGTDVWKISSTPSFVFNNGQKILRGGKTIESFDGIIKWLEENPPAQVSMQKEAPAEATDAETTIEE